MSAKALPDLWFDYGLRLYKLCASLMGLSLPNSNHKSRFEYSLTEALPEKPLSPQAKLSEYYRHFKLLTTSGAMQDLYETNLTV